MKRIIISLIFLYCASVNAGSDVENSGNVIHVLLPATAFGASLFFEDDYQGVWQLIKSGVTSRIVVEGLKAAITKDRPDNSGDDSFASGHAADSFAASTFIHQRYGLKCAIPAYLAATYVGYTRVESDKHEVEDVLLGAVIGSVSAWYFTERYKGMSIVPVVSSSGQFGVSVNGKF